MSHQNHMVQRLDALDGEYVQMTFGIRPIHAPDQRDVHGPTETGGVVAGGHHEMQIQLGQFHDAVQMKVMGLQIRVQHDTAVEALTVEDKGNVLEHLQIGAFRREEFPAFRIPLRKVLFKHVVRNDQIDPFVQQRLNGELAAIHEALVHQHDVELIFENAFGQLFGSGVTDLEKHVGIDLFELRQQIGEQDPIASLGRSQTNDSPSGLTDVVELAFQVPLEKLDLAQHVQHGFAGYRQFQPGRAFEKRDAVFLLEVFQVFAQTLMGNKQPFRGAGDVLLLGKSDEIVVIVQHDASPRK